jgi:hypothetical protein
MTLSPNPSPSFAAVVRLIFSMGLAAVPYLLTAQVDHSPRWVSSTNLTYGLVDLDGFPAGSYAYCRWGNFMDYNSFGTVDMAFRSLTAPPYSNSNTDLFITPGSGRLSFRGSILQRVTYNNQPFPNNAVWTPPSGSFSGLIEFDAADNELELYRYLHFQNLLIDQVSGTAIPSVARKLVILIHGYNHSRIKDQILTDAPSEFKNLSGYLQSALGNTDWRLAHYHWEVDSDTGQIGDGGPYTNPTAAAETSNLHGQHLGELLAKGYPNLEKIQLIAHSAGAWAARSTARYILKNLPNCAVQVTLLDPFMPTALFPSPDTVLGDAVMDVFDSIEGNQQLKTLENYFADEVSLLGGVWSYGTQETFAWERPSDRTVQVDGQFGSSAYSLHTGPIQFYADTVNATLPGQIRAPALAPFNIEPTSAIRVGWTRSLFYNEALIQQNPQSQTVAVGATVTLSSAGSSRNSGASDNNVSYQWRRNNVPLLGATNATLQISSAQPSNAGDYTVTVSNAWGATTSSTATLVVGESAPTIIVQPQAQSANVGQTITLSVTASGTPAPTYQWSKSGVIIAGATTSTLTLNNVQPGDAGSYTVVVTNSVGSVTSNAASLAVVTVLSNPVGNPSGAGLLLSANQFLAARFTVATSSKIVAATAEFSNSSGSFFVAIVPLGSTSALPVGTPAQGIPFNAGEVVAVATFTLPAGFSGIYTVPLNFDAASGVYGIVFGSGLFGTSGTCGMPRFEPATGSGSFFWSQSPYRWQNGGAFQQKIGIVVLNGSAVAPIIVTQPAGQAVVAGGAAALSVVAAGTAPLNYQWRKNGTTVAGATNATFVISNALAADAGSYSVVVSNSAGNVTSNAVALSIVAPPTLVSGTPLSSLSGATGGQQFYRIVVPAGQTRLVISTAGVTGDVDLYVRFGALPGLATYDFRPLLIGNSETVTVDAPAAGEWYVMLNGSIAYSGITLAAQYGVAPVITVQPISQVVSAGANVTFVVVATGSPSPTYQWRKGGTNIAGATNASIVLSNVQAADAASYSVVVSNFANGVVSDAATLTVNKAPQTITFGSLADKTYGAAPFVVSATASSGLAVGIDVVSGPATIADGSVTLTGAGTVTLRASQPGNASYTAASDVDRSFTVAKATLTFTADDKSRVYGAANPQLTEHHIGLVNGDTISAVTTPSLSTTASSVAPAGNYPITLTGGSAANYTLILVNGTLTVTKAPLTITAANQSRTYGTANSAVALSYVGFVNNETAAAIFSPIASTSATTGSAVGSYPIILVSGGTATNYALTLVGGTLTVTKAPLTVTATNQTRLYGAANPALTFAYIGFVNNDTSASLTSAPTAGTTATTASAAGTYPITLTGGTAANYMLTLVNATLSVTKATLTATAENKTRAYGAANPSLTIAYSGFVNNDTVAAVSPPLPFTTATVSTGVGTYPITLSLGFAANYEITLVSGVLTVGKAPLTITAANLSRTYGAANPTFTFTYSGFLNNDTVAAITVPTASTTATAASAVGTYPITVSGGSATNYALTLADGTLTVAKAPLTVTAENASRAIGAANPAFTLSYAGFVNNDTTAALTAAPTASTAATTASGAGTYPITLAGGSAANYALTLINGTLTVTGASQAITFAAPANRTYGDASFAVSATSDSALPVTLSIVSGPATIASNTVTLTGAGTVTLRATQSGNSTYSPASSVERSFTVAKAPLTVTAAAKTRLYGAANPALTLTYAGFVGSDTAAALTAPVASTTATTTSAVGTYPITLTGGTAANYTLTLVNGTLTVTKAPLTVTAANQSRLYGAANPALTLGYAGFVNNDTAAILTVIPTASTAATTTTLPGTYAITLTGGTAANYTLTLVNGTLTVAPRDFSGTYFGTFASGGHWALIVRANSTATYIAYLPARHSAIVVSLTVGLDGTFTVTGTEIKPLSAASVSGYALATPEAPVLKTSAAAGDFTLSGQIGADGAISGALTGLGETFTGVVDPDSGPVQTTAGLYTAAALDTASGATYTIVGGSGQAVVVTTTPTAVDGAAGTVSAAGQLTATTSNNAALSVSINAAAQTVSASLTPAGSSTPITYAGLSATVTPIARVVNLSVRTTAGTGDQTLIVGLVIIGSGNKTLLLRGIGPALVPQGVTNALADPTMRLLSGNGAEVSANNDWGGATQMSTHFAAVGAFALPANSKDAALYNALPTGLYSFHIFPNGAGTGIALAEVYDADDDTSAASVVNISARTQVGTGENILIAGFVITGNSPKTLLIRGLGPTLAAQGVTGALVNPQLYLFGGAGLIASNDDWGGTTALKASFTATGAGALVSDTSKDAALLVTLQHGVYSAQVSGVASTTGVGLVEIFLMP